MEDETENEVKHTSSRITTSPPQSEEATSKYSRNITASHHQHQPPRNNETTRTFTFAAGREHLGAIAILLAIIGAFFSVISFTLDHAAIVMRLHQPIFSEWNLATSVIIVVGLVVAYLHHPQHKWIYYSIASTSVVFVLLPLGNFILHVCLIDQTDFSSLKTDDQKSIGKIIQAGAAFTFLDGILKVLVTVICIVIVRLKI